MDARKRKTVYTIVERDGRCWWRPLGVGFVNADGSIEVRLDAFPQNGTLQIRDVAPHALAQAAGT
ncbi:MAG: hypothetical protein KF764_17760 [Labilithrix sp.]|nr:hypothetical protein [Labilithrix sp.]